MPYGSNSENSPDPVPNSPPFPQAPITERPRIEPDRVVAYLRSVIRNPEPPPKPEPRILSFLRRKRRPEADAMPHIAPSLAAPARIRAEAAAVAPAPEPVVEQTLPEPLQAFSPEPSVADSAPAEAAPAELIEAVSAPEPIQVAEASLEPATAPAEPEPCVVVETASAPTAEEFPEALATSSVPMELEPELAPEPVFEPIPEPLVAAAAEPVLEPAIEPIPQPPAAAPAPPEPLPRPAILRGEVLPPEAFRSGSPERRRPSEPARVITMQPAVRQDSGETPPPRRA